jgi:hypothetical protein
MYHSLLKTWTSRASLLSLKKSSPLSLQAWMAPWTLPRQSSHERLVVAAREGGKGDAKGLQLARGTDPVQRPGILACPAPKAQDGTLVGPVEDGPLHLLKMPADGINDEQI